MAMDLDELRGILRAEKADALSADEAAKLSEDRRRAIDYYNGDVSDDIITPTDRSKAVSFDVSDTIEGMMPALMEIFASGEEVVNFEPVGPEDEEAAQQETDYVNHVFLQKNPGFQVLYAMVKDALLSKVGVVKVWWEEYEKYVEESYRNIPEDGLALLKGDPDIEITEDEPHPDMMTGQMLHDVRVSRSKDYACAKVEGVPPEEFGISRLAKSIGDANYAFHTRPNRTQNDLIGEGFDEDQVKRLATSPATPTLESLARDTVDEGIRAGSGDQRQGGRPITTTEHYVDVDYEENGQSQLYRVVTAGETEEILERKGKPAIDKVDMMPFAAMTPVIVTHRFYGRSIADLVMDIQRIKTSLLRGALDNIYLANNQRIEISESHAGKNTIDDLLTNRPGGIVRTKAPGGLLPIPNQELGSFVYPMIEYMDGVREWRTGVSKQAQGLDPDSLQNQSATASAAMFRAAEARLKLVARIFAETGIRDLFSLLHATIRKNDRQQNTVRLRNKWVTVDPRDWKERNDMTINVGLGSGSKLEQKASLMQIVELQKEAMMAPQLGLVKPDNLYNSAKKLVELNGLKSTELYFTDPSNNPAPQPPPPDPKLVEIQAKMELEKVQAQADIATQDKKTEAEIALAQMKFEFDKQLAMLEFQIKEQGQQHDQRMQAAQHNHSMIDNSAGGGGTAQPDPIMQLLSALAQGQERMTQAMTHMGSALTAPKRVLRDPTTNQVTGMAIGSPGMQ